MSHWDWQGAWVALWEAVANRHARRLCVLATAGHLYALCALRCMYKGIAQGARGFQAQRRTHECTDVKQTTTSSSWRWFVIYALRATLGSMYKMCSRCVYSNCIQMPQITKACGTRLPPPTCGCWLGWSTPSTTATTVVQHASLAQDTLRFYQEFL